MDGVEALKAAMDALEAHRTRRPKATGGDRRQLALKECWAGYSPEAREARIRHAERRAELGRIAKGLSVIGDDACLASLPSRTAEVLHLRYLDRRRPAEIALLLNTTKAMVQVHAARGMALLRELREAA